MIKKNRRPPDHECSRVLSPVALELEANGQLAVTSELRLIERANLPATLFEAPAGYARAAHCPGR